MLLFLLSDKFRELPEPPPPADTSAVKLREDARALLLAGLFLSVWCVLRLLVAGGRGSSVDIVLALLCLCLGIGAVSRGAQGLRVGYRSYAGARAWG